MFDVRPVPSTIDSAGLNPDQRDSEVSKMLSLAVRRFHLQRGCRTIAMPKTPDSGERPLEVSARMRLSVTDG